jgi:hypothetical protein
MGGRPVEAVRKSVTFYPAGEDSPEPTTSADAVRALREIAPVIRRSRRLARDAHLARPLLAWGLAWMAGAALLEYVPGPGGMIGASAASAGAAAITWLARSRDVRLPTQRQFTLLWLAFLASTPLLVAVAAPGNTRLMTVFLASLWAVAMVMYGLGTRDTALAAVGSATVVTAAVTRIAAPADAMLIVGLCGGLGMAALGTWRIQCPWWMQWKR